MAEYTEPEKQTIVHSECNDDGDNNSIIGNEPTINSETNEDKIIIRITLDKSDLDCAICTNNLTSQIWRCENGPHYVCQTCRKKINKCSICGCVGLFRDIQLEQQMIKHIVECKYKCSQYIFKWNTDHEENCTHKPLTCPLCKTKMNYNNEVFANHMNFACLMANKITRVHHNKDVVVFDVNNKRYVFTTDLQIESMQMQSGYLNKDEYVMNIGYPVLHRFDDFENKGFELTKQMMALSNSNPKIIRKIN